MIQLKNINRQDFKDIAYLTSLKEVMKYVGDGKTWKHKKVENFIKYCEMENKQSDKTRTNYYYKIVNKRDNLVGIIGFHLFKSFPNYYLSVYINPKYQGKGYFNKSLSLLLKKVAYNKPKEKFIISLVYEKNDKMNTISKKKFQYMNSIFLNKNRLNQYKINIPEYEKSKKSKKSKKIKKSKKSKKNKQ